MEYFKPKQNFNQTNQHIIKFLVSARSTCSRAADLLFEGRMRPAGHVLPSPALKLKSIK